MDTQKIKEEVTRIVESGQRRPTASSPPISTTSEVVDMIMSVIDDVAGDEYERGRGDGAFNESFYNRNPGATYQDLEF